MVNVRVGVVSASLLDVTVIINVINVLFFTVLHGLFIYKARLGLDLDSPKMK